MSSSIIQVIISILTCNRRSPSIPKTSQKVHGASGKTVFVRKDSKRSKASEFGYASAGASTDAPPSDHWGYSDGGSSSEANEALFPSSKNGAGPPGLDVPPWQQNMMLRTAGAGSQHHRRPGPPCDSEALTALKDALDKLAPSDIATVKSMLDAKANSGDISRDQFGTARQFAPYRGDRGSNSRPFDLNRMKPKTRMQRLPPEEAPDSLSSFLKELSTMDDSCVISVRKINRLGFESGPVLQAYFEKFGKVERVMVAPTQVRNKSVAANGKPRMRPAGLGFVVMSTPEEVKTALAHGEEQVVEGVEIAVYSFESHPVEDTK